MSPSVTSHAVIVTDTIGRVWIGVDYLYQIATKIQASERNTEPRALWIVSLSSLTGNGNMLKPCVMWVQIPPETIRGRSSTAEQWGSVLDGFERWPYKPFH